MPKRSSIPWDILTEADWKNHTDVELTHGMSQVQIFTSQPAVCKMRKVKSERTGKDLSYKGEAGTRLDRNKIIALGDKLKPRVEKAEAQAAKAAAKAAAAPAPASVAKRPGRPKASAAAPAVAATAKKRPGRPKATVAAAPEKVAARKPRKPRAENAAVSETTSTPVVLEDSGEA